MWASPIQTFNLDCLSILDRSGEGDWSSSQHLQASSFEIRENTYCLDATDSELISQFNLTHHSSPDELEVGHYLRVAVAAHWLACQG